MSDPTLLLIKLRQIEEALKRVERRFHGIHEPDDFLESDEGLDKLDAICMMLIAVGESLKKIDSETGGKLLQRYPEINWKGVKGVRDILSHHYFNIDAEEIFYICRHHLAPLQDTISHMIGDLPLNPLAP